VDESGVLLDVVTGIRAVPDDVQVVIMAGGLGTRLNERTLTTPKPLLPVAGRPILQRIVERLESAGFRKLFISVNYLADQIVDFFQKHPPASAEIRFLREETRLGTAGALSLLTERPVAPLLVTNADLVTGIDFEALLRFHFDHNFEATVGAAMHAVEIPYGVIECDEHGLIHGIREKPRMDYFVNAGMYVLNPPVWDLIPARTCVDMPDILNQALAKGLRIGAFPIHEEWIDVGRIGDLTRAQRRWSDEWPEF
jgi:NDP-sugar pyrophosphorylase family protein